MNPYRDALRKKKFDGLPNEELLQEEQQAAAGGDAAPSIYEGDMANSQEVASLGEMADEQLPIGEEDMNIYVENAQATPGIEDLTSEEVFGVSAPLGRPKSLTERVQQSLKKRK